MQTHFTRLISGIVFALGLLGVTPSFACPAGGPTSCEPVSTILFGYTDISTLTDSARFGLATAAGTGRYTTGLEILTYLSAKNWTFSGAVNATTQSANDNSTKIATTAYVDASKIIGANFVFDGDSRTCGVGSTSDPACSSIPFTIGTTGYAAATTGTASAASTALTIASGTGTANGQIVVGAGIAPNTTVSSGGGTTSIVLSVATVKALSTTPVKFGNTDYGSQAMTLPPLSGHGTGYNLGVGGQTCAQIAQRYAADAHTLSPAVTGLPGYLSVECGTNALGPITTTGTGTSTQFTIVVASVSDIDFGQAVTGTGIGSNAKVATTWTGSTTVPLTVANSGTVSGTITFTASSASIFASIANVWALGQTDGYKIIAHTTPDFFTSSSNRQILIAYNALIRAARASYDYLADDASILTDIYNLSYYYTDNLHFTNSGYGIFAQATANALQLTGAERMGPSAIYQTFGSGTQNVRLNQSAMPLANSGSKSLAGGEFAGSSCTNCGTTFMFGTSAGGDLTTSSGCTLIGYLAFGNATGCTSSTFIGGQAGTSATASNDTGIGNFALASDAGANGQNTAVGNGSLSSATGGFNAALGNNAGSAIVAGAANVAIGQAANTTTVGGSNTVVIGENAQPAGASDNNEIVIGQGATGAGTNTATLGNSSITSTILRGLTQVPGIQSTGTKFSVTGCGTATSLAGGSMAGQFTGGSATCTPVITTNVTATNGYSCSMQDQTTATALFRETANNATTVTFTAGGIVGATDVINFACTAF